MKRFVSMETNNNLLSLLTLQLSITLFKMKLTRKPVHQGERHAVVEPIRPSILDVVENNLKLAKRLTSLHRLIYFAKHSFGGSSILDAMEQNFKESNAGYHTEPLSGLFLHYRGYFCYIVEGSEDVLQKHLSLFFQHFGNRLVGHPRLLSVIHHVKGRFNNEWLSYHGRPPIRIEDIDPDSSLDVSMRYVSECCEKLYNFAAAFVADQLTARAREQTRIIQGEKEKLEIEENEIPMPFRISKSIVERDVYSDFLPEETLLNFLLNCKHVKDLSEFHQCYGYVGQSRDYNSNIFVLKKNWPAPKNLIPHNVFDGPQNPIGDLPLENVEHGRVKELIEESVESENVETNIL